MICNVCGSELTVCDYCGTRFQLGDEVFCIDSGVKHTDNQHCMGAIIDAVIGDVVEE